MNGIILAKLQDTEFVFADLYKIPFGPFLQILKVPLYSSTAVQHTNCSPSFGVILRLAEAAPQPVIDRTTSRSWVILATVYLSS